MKKIISVLLVVCVLFGMSTVAMAENVTDDVKFFIQVKGLRLDTDGQVRPHPATEFTPSIATTKLKSPLDSKYATTNKDEIIKNLISLPNEQDVFDLIKELYVPARSYILDNNQKVISWKKFSTDNYCIEWYVLKYETDSFWHVDGIVYDKLTKEPVNIVTPAPTVKDEDIPKPDDEDPTEDENNVEKKYNELGAKVIHYDVDKGTYAIGRMGLIGHTPDGSDYADMHYTVLNDNEFINTDEELSDSAYNEAVRRVTGIYRISEDALQNNENLHLTTFGRIDSNGFHSSLGVTPYAYKRIRQNYGDNMYLCIADGKGNIKHAFMVIDEAVQHSDDFAGNISPYVYTFTSRGFKSFKK